MRDQKLGKDDIIYLLIAFSAVIYFLISYPITTENIKEKDLPDKKIKSHRIVLDDGTDITVYNYGSQNIYVPVKEICLAVFILLTILLYIIREINLKGRR